MKEELGRLTKVPLRKFWEHEEDDFTPWLAREENISLLSETIRMELEVEGTEINVGPFEADILCRDTVTDKQIVIENQLEPTDHKHLGQLLTYAPGLNAVTAIWIAEHFRDEHRAALDWLNQITPEDFSFFGLEIELWRIGDSPMAPKFNVVSHPNSWQKTVARISRGELSTTNQLYLEYWTKLRNLLEQPDGVINPREPRTANWLGVSIGRSKFLLAASASVRDRWICVSLTLRGPDAKPHFHLLGREKADIEEDIGDKLEWDEKDDWERSEISLSFPEEIDLEDRGDWDRQHEWLCDKLEVFHKVFSPRVKVLDASDYVSEEDETDE